MKKPFALFLAMCLLSVTMGQLKATVKCDPFVVDILNGSVNGLKSDATIHDIKEKFPCFSSAEEESSTAKCGGGVYFKDRDLVFYTQRDYIEIGPKFQGKITPAIIGAKRNALFNWFGNPKLKDQEWDAYQTSYGTLILHFDKLGKVILVQFSILSTDVIKLCN